MRDKEAGRRFPRGMRALIGILSLILVWWAASLAAGGKIIPSPPTVIVRFVQLLPSILLPHILWSLLRISAAMALAFLTAAPAGLALGRVRGLDRVFSPLAYLLYPVPKIALLPVVMLIFGLTDASRIAIVYLVLFFQVLVAVRDGAARVRPEHLLSLRSLGDRRLDSLRFVIWPSLLPSLLTTLRIAAGTALAVLFFAETFGTQRGLGYFTVESWMRVSYTDMFAGILGLGLLGFGLFTVLDLIEARVCRWQKRENDR